MLTRGGAQELADALAAIALGAGALASLRRGPRSPFELRLVFAFGGLFLFFVSRAAAEALAHPDLSLIVNLMVCPLPVVGLVLAEGALRRHAPLALKIAITAGAVATAVTLIASDEAAWSTRWIMGGYVILSLLALTLLLLTRDRTSLSHQENVGIDTLMLAAGGLTLLSLTDFLPTAPIGMSGTGAALLAYFIRLSPGSPRAIGRAAGDIALITLAAALMAVTLAQVLGLTTPAEMARLGVLFLAFAVALIAARGAWRERSRDDEARSLRRALATADTSGLAAFLEGLADQPLLQGLRVAEGGMLDDYDPTELSETLGTRPVWNGQALSAAGAPGSARGREELSDLMDRTDASHAALISRRPLRIALLTLPQTGAGDEAEIDLALFRKLAAIAAEERP